MSRKGASGRAKKVSVPDSGATHLPGAAKGVESLGISGSLIVLSLILSYFVGHFNLAQRPLFPMHGPVLMGGLLLSPIYAALVGILIPAISSGLVSYPQFGQATHWMIELAVCGGVTSLLTQLIFRKAGALFFVGKAVRMLGAVLGGWVAAFVVYALLLLRDVGGTDTTFWINSFFSASYPSFILITIILPVIGVKLRHAASH